MRRRRGPARVFVSIRVPAEDVARLRDIRQRARAAGRTLDIAGALTATLRRVLRAAEQRLTDGEGGSREKEDTGDHGSCSGLG